MLEQTCEYPFELIVVDNASSDSTRAVTRSFEGSPLIRYAHEQVIGLSHARNTGRKLARGRYLPYLDDDAIAMPGWVRAIVVAFNVTSRVAAVGGRVEPIWEAPRPEWLSDTLALGLAVANWSDQPSLLRDVSKQWRCGTAPISRVKAPGAGPLSAVVVTTTGASCAVCAPTASRHRTTSSYASCTGIATTGSRRQRERRQRRATSGRAQRTVGRAGSPSSATTASRIASRNARPQRRSGSR